MGKNDNAIRLQILAAMIAYLLLRIAPRLNSLKMLDLRFAELVASACSCEVRSQKSTGPHQSIPASQSPGSLPINWVRLRVIFPDSPAASGER